MNTFMLLQVSENVVRKSAEMAARDPHGVIITVVSVAVVFTALVVLYFAYTFVGKAVNGKFDWKSLVRRFKRKSKGKGMPSEEEAAAIAMALDQELNGETYAAIGLALHQYLNDTVHDNESYIITIKRK
ncbi:MAG: OadG family protein [Bacteroidales bacterium]|nr:OadG family protein [Bacteroidales bacterium]